MVYQRAKPPSPVVQLPPKEPVAPAIVEVARAVPVVHGRSTNIVEKLEMLYLLRANENNEPYIRSIGSAYRIGEEMEGEYVITLDNRNTAWMQFLNKNE